jgi:hypothetical protein
MFEMPFRASEHGLLMNPAERRDRLKLMTRCEMLRLNSPRYWRSAGAACPGSKGATNYGFVGVVVGVAVMLVVVWTL